MIFDRRGILGWFRAALAELTLHVEYEVGLKAAVVSCSENPVRGDSPA